MQSEILEMLRAGEDIYTRMTEKCLDGRTNPQERIFTKTVFYSLLYGNSREETGKRVAEAMKFSDPSLVLSRRQALQKHYPELGSREFQTRFCLALELTDLRCEIEDRIRELCE